PSLTKTDKTEYPLNPTRIREGGVFSRVAGHSASSVLVHLRANLLKRTRARSVVGRPGLIAAGSEVTRGLSGRVGALCLCHVSRDWHSVRVQQQLDIGRERIAFIDLVQHRPRDPQAEVHPHLLTRTVRPDIGTTGCDPSPLQLACEHLLGHVS